MLPPEERGIDVAASGAQGTAMTGERTWWADLAELGKRSPGSSRALVAVAQGGPWNLEVARRGGHHTPKAPRREVLEGAARAPSACPRFPLPQPACEASDRHRRPAGLPRPPTPLPAAAQPGLPNQWPPPPTGLPACPLTPRRSFTGPSSTAVPITCLAPALRADSHVPSPSSPTSTSNLKLF